MHLLYIGSVPADLRITYPTALVLTAVAGGLRHGFDIIDATGLRSGTVYPILRRLEEAALLRSHWEGARTAHAAGRPPRRYYELTGTGVEAAREALRRYPRIAQVAGAGDGRAPLPA